MIMNEFMKNISFILRNLISIDNLTHDFIFQLQYLLFLTKFQELEMRIETQKQTLQARDESIKKLLEMLQSKGEGKRIPLYIKHASRKYIMN